MLRDPAAGRARRRRVTIPGLDDDSVPGVLPADMPPPGPSLGRFAEGGALLRAGVPFRLDLEAQSGDDRRAPLLHPEVFAAIRQGCEVLLGDTVRLRVERCGPGFAETTVLAGGPIGEGMRLRLAPPAPERPASTGPTPC